MVSMVLCSGFLMAGAQIPFTFNHFTSEDGLSHDDTVPVAQDSSGFIWIGSYNGLSRWDGSRFKTYFETTDEHSLANNKISCLHVGSDNTLWITTEVGLCSMDLETEIITRHLHPGTDELSPKRAEWVIEDRQGRIWVTYDNHYPSGGGVWQFDKKTGQFTEAIPEIGAVFITQDDANDELFWIGSYRSMYSLNSATGEYEKLYCEGCNEMGYSFQWIEQINADEMLVLSYVKGVYKYSKSRREWTQISTDSAGLCLLHDEGPYWWITTAKHGVGKINVQTGISEYAAIGPNSKHSFPVLRAKHLLLDASGSLWITHREGVSVIGAMSRQITTIDFREAVDGRALKADACFSTTDGSELVVSANTNQGILFVDKKSGRIKDHLLHYTHDEWTDIRVYVNDFHAYGKDTLLFSNSRGLFLLDIQNRKTSVLVDKNKLGLTQWLTNFTVSNDLACISGRGLNIHLFHIKTKELEVIQFLDTTGVQTGPLGRPVWDDYGRIWIPAEERPGFYDVEAREYTELTDLIDIDIAETLPRCRALAPLGDSIVYFSTQFNGLVEINLNSRSYESIPYTDGTTGYHAVHVIADKQNNIWSATNRGILKWDPKRREVAWFDVRHGLPMNAINKGHMELGFDNTIAIGNSHYAIWFDPSSIGIHDVEPEIKLVDFDVVGGVEFDKSIHLIENIKLGVGQGTFDFAFASPNIAEADVVDYQYMLEGFDDTWYLSGSERQGRYIRVPGGEYLLRVKGRVGNGPWSSSEAQISIEIATPFYSQLWFIILIATTALAIVFMVYYLRLRQAKRQAQVQAEFQAKLASVEMTALRAQMNPHFLFNCLNSIKYFIVKNQSDLAADYLTKFSRLIRLILNNSKSEFVLLENELDALELYIQMEALRFENEFSYDLKIGADVHAEFVKIPPLLIQPFVENSIWHGLLHLDKPGHLLVDIKRKDETLICTIEDNGVGRKKSFELKSKTSTKNKSLGMEITGNRIETINDLYQTKAQITITDLENNEGKALGTRVILQIPI